MILIFDLQYQNTGNRVLVNRFTLSSLPKVWHMNTSHWESCLVCNFLACWRKTNVWYAKDFRFYLLLNFFQMPNRKGNIYEIRLIFNYLLNSLCVFWKKLLSLLHHCFYIMTENLNVPYMFHTQHSSTRGFSSFSSNLTVSFHKKKKQIQYLRFHLFVFSCTHVCIGNMIYWGFVVQIVKEVEFFCPGRI